MCTGIFIINTAISHKNKNAYVHIYVYVYIHKMHRVYGPFIINDLIISFSWKHCATVDQLFCFINMQQNTDRLSDEGSHESRNKQRLYLHV